MGKRWVQGGKSESSFLGSEPWERKQMLLLGRTLHLYIVLVETTLDH